MEVLDLEKLHLLFLFAVPGMVFLYVRAQFLDGRLPSIAEGAIIYIVLSLIYHALWFTCDPRIYGFAISDATIFQKLIWVGVIFIIPAALGLLSATNIRFRWIASLFKKVGLTVIHPVPTAWDWKFSGIKESWVLVTLKNETKWRGVLGENSFISSSSQERDIFIEKVFTVDKNGNWVERTSGVLITHDQIETIEFWPKGS
jgi:Family of unknown function (DUF6338)